VAARYTYGDSDRAADRLTLVASMFAPASEAFMRSAVRVAPSRAVDLGCGPGEATSSLHNISGARTTVGIDRSLHFLRRAVNAALPGISFIAGDVERLPIRDADLLYARLLLAHIAEPVAMIHRWGTSMSLGGRLLVDDLERIDADEAAFRTYLDEVALTVVSRAGGSLFVGPTLTAAVDPPNLERVHDEVVLVVPDPSVTAKVFGLNLRELTARGETDERPDLATELDRIANGAIATPVRWQMRHLAWERRDPT
jgi:trans-aconitate 2-methyltransferase